MRILITAFLCSLAISTTLGCVRPSNLPSPMMVEVARESPDYRVVPSPVITEVPRSTARYTMVPSPVIVEVPRTTTGTSASPATVAASAPGDQTPGVIAVTSQGQYDNTSVVDEWQAPVRGGAACNGGLRGLHCSPSAAAWWRPRRVRRS